MLSASVPKAPRIPLTDDVVVTARRLTRWIRIVAALQLVGVLGFGFAAFGFLFLALFSPSAGIVWVVFVLGLVVWTARGAALGKAAHDLDDMRHGLVQAHDRVVRGMWGIANAMMLDALAIVAAVGTFAMLWWRSAN